MGKQQISQRDYTPKPRVSGAPPWENNESQASSRGCLIRAVWICGTPLVYNPLSIHYPGCAMRPWAEVASRLRVSPIYHVLHQKPQRDFWEIASRFRLCSWLNARRGVNSNQSYGTQPILRKTGGIRGRLGDRARARLYDLLPLRRCVGRMI